MTNKKSKNKEEHFLNIKKLEKKLEKLKLYIDEFLKLEFSGAGAIAGYTLPLGMKPPEPMPVTAKKEKKKKKKKE